MELINLSYGFNAWDAFLAVELGEDFEFQSDVRAWSASMVLHPGEGYLLGVQGEEKIRGLTSLKELSLKKTGGGFVPARKGVGEELGHVLLSHRQPRQLLEDLQFCESELKFEKLPPA
jgi:hypothetical protein